MQTFLPYADFEQSAKVLDRQRLGKQRVEGLQILRTLLGHTTGWANHPAVKMWKGYELALAEYVLAICDEWIARGYRDSCKDELFRLMPTGFNELPQAYLPKPYWLGLEEFHESHRSNLLRKDPGHYQQFGWSESADMPYVWPV